MNNKVFQDIFDRIQDYLPVGWKRMIFFAGYTEGSYSMKFYSQDEKGEYLDCFNMQGITKGQLVKLFMDIDKVLSKERIDLDDKQKWSFFTMIVEVNGAMKAEFDYEDHTNDMISYEKQWREKYL
jgi:hypothetical protein